MKPTIESGIPLPDRGRDGSTQKELRTALRNMKHGDSFVWPDNDFPYRAAKDLGIKVTSRKLNGTGYRFWKKETK